MNMQEIAEKRYGYPTIKKGTKEDKKNEQNLGTMGENPKARNSKL